MLTKAIKSGKEHRKEYRKAKLHDDTCRNHGTCPYCRQNRLHKFTASKFRKADSNKEDGLIEKEEP